MPAAVSTGDAFGTVMQYESLASTSKHMHVPPQASGERGQGERGKEKEQEKEKGGEERGAEEGAGLMGQILAARSQAMDMDGGSSEEETCVPPWPWP